MKVYVVNFRWDYEGEDTRGVFSTLEKAEAALAAADKGFTDGTPIYEFEVDAGLISNSLDKTEVGGTP